MSTHIQSIEFIKVQLATLRAGYFLVNLHVRDYVESWYGKSQSVL